MQSFNVFPFPLLLFLFSRLSFPLSTCSFLVKWLSSPWCSMVWLELLNFQWAPKFQVFWCVCLSSIHLLLFFVLLFWALFFVYRIHFDYVDVIFCLCLVYLFLRERRKVSLTLSSFSFCLGSLFCFPWSWIHFDFLGFISFLLEFSFPVLFLFLRERAQFLLTLNSLSFYMFHLVLVPL